MVRYTKFRDDRPIRSRVIPEKPEGVASRPPPPLCRRGIYDWCTGELGTRCGVVSEISPWLRVSPTLAARAGGPCPAGGDTRRGASDRDRLCVRPCLCRCRPDGGERHGTTPSARGCPVCRRPCPARIAAQTPHGIDMTPVLQRKEMNVVRTGNHFLWKALWCWYFS